MLDYYAKLYRFDQDARNCINTNTSQAFCRYVVVRSDSCDVNSLLVNPQSFEVFNNSDFTNRLNPIGSFSGNYNVISSNCQALVQQRGGFLENTTDYLFGSLFGIACLLLAFVLIFVPILKRHL